MSLLGMGNVTRRLCYSPFLSFSIRVTSEVGWATPKKRQSPNHTPSSPPFSLPCSPPSSTLPHPLWKTQGISRQSSVCLSGRLLNHPPARAPGQLSPQSGEHLWDVGPWLKNPYCGFQLQHRRSEWRGAAQKSGEHRGGQRWVLSRAAWWRHSTTHRSNSNWHETPTAGDKKGKCHLTQFCFCVCVLKILLSSSCVWRCKHESVWAAGEVREVRDFRTLGDVRICLAFLWSEDWHKFTLDRTLTTACI